MGKKEDRKSKCIGKPGVAKANRQKKNKRTSPDIRVFQKFFQIGFGENRTFANLFFSYQFINQSVEFSFKLFIKFSGGRSAKSRMYFPDIPLFIDENSGWKRCNPV